jgi:hypothetical protein
MSPHFGADDGRPHPQPNFHLDEALIQQEKDPDVQNIGVDQPGACRLSGHPPRGVGGGAWGEALCQSET